MPDTKSTFLHVSCWLLLAVTSIPAIVSAAPFTQVPDAGSPDTFPLVEEHFAVQQAHLAYLAGKEVIGMQATIRYLGARGGSVGTLSALKEEAGASAAAISSAGSYADLDAELEHIRTVTRTFRTETDAQMPVVHGNPDELRAEVQSAVDGSNKAGQLLDTYWQVRENTELAGFDLRLSHARETLGSFMEHSHEITPAQEKFEEIVTMRTELATALRTRNNAGIELAHKKIHTTSIEYARMINNLRSSGSADYRLDQTIDQGIGVMTRSGLVNANLDHSGIDTAAAAELVRQGKNQVLRAQELSRKNDRDGARESLYGFRDTLKSLRDTYRRILVAEDLPQATAQGVLSVAQSLDTTAAQVGAL
jgi:hypothetical protein